MRSDLGANFKVGLFITAALVLFAVFVFGLSAERAIFKKTYIVKTSFPNTAGLLEGAAVKLSGVRIGTVYSIEFPKDPSLRYVTVVMKVRGEGMRRITSDSKAAIKTEGLLGDKYIEIIPGEERLPEKLPAELAIGSYSYPEYDVILGQSEELIDNLISISQGLREMVGGFKQEENLKNITSIISSLRNTLVEIEKGDGALHTLIYGSKDETGRQVKSNVLERLDVTLTELNGMLSDFRGSRGLLYSLVYDERLKKNVEGSIESLNSALSEFSGEEGIASQLKIAARNFRAISERLEGGEGTLGAFLVDPQLYDQLKGVVGQAERSKFVRGAVRYLIERRREQEGSN
ncbi:MAG: MlaD family protein [Candidatus Methanosuratincola sp.]|jgi:phospholipid/cholesterol/gamma-HCH transport system substrate-binding protein